ncbi:hypothetical protein CMV_002760 [Castanea mollissima]|uniref:Uncharacterized protein n=1 Tax=Castanea mollissima TaxID=60419 RepID=A0A8J4RVG1_9ROSI|nr:hypothetical protein CMV_002760 [Castanea mollissima]
MVVPGDQHTLIFISLFQLNQLIRPRRQFTGTSKGLICLLIHLELSSLLILGWLNINEDYQYLTFVCSNVQL